MSDAPALQFSDCIWKLNRPYLMGVMNLTSDSFFPESRITSDEMFSRKLKEMLPYMDILDLGAESTRPGADSVSAKKELSELLPKLKYLKQNYPKIKVSIDTSKVRVARECIAHGADMINDVSAGEFSKGEIFSLCALTQTPMVLMHKQGIPKTMQNDVFYRDVVDEVYHYLQNRLKLAYEYGLSSKQLLVDVGIGFGKKLNHNLDLLRHLPKFNGLGVGVLLGASRKSMIGDITGQPVEKRLAGSIAIHLAALVNSCHMIRCHDVREMWDAIQVFSSVIDLGVEMVGMNLKVKDR